MTHADGPDPDPALTERNHTQHELNTPLTVILGRAQLLTRAVQRSSALPEPERGALLDGLAAIEAAARAGDPGRGPRTRGPRRPHPRRRGDRRDRDGRAALARAVERLLDQFLGG
jgi:signal transduction histidine kinase